MKILFYDWALHTIGGGQKFNCKIIEHLLKKHDVDIVTLFPIDLKQLEKFYSVNLSKAKIITLYPNSSLNPALLKIIASKRVSHLSRNYDLFFNGDAQESVKPKAKQNIMYCHFFEPLWYRPSKGFIDFFKLLFIYLLRKFKGNYAKRYSIYCNSLYTKGWLKKLWNVNSEIIYPPVDIPKIKKLKKENIILSTGRISPDKNYEFVIDVFKEAYSSLKNYKLIICGKSDNVVYLDKLKKMSKNLPVEFLTDVSDESLKKIYSKSKIFIQAKGMDNNDKRFPGLVEHFGMTSAEAMSYGCIPLLLNKGGYTEIVNKNTGFIFNNKEEAVKSLVKLISNKKLLESMCKAGIQRAKKFSLERMQKEIDQAVN